MPHFMVEAVIESDRSDDSMAMFIEGLLYQHFHNKVADLSVYKINFTGAPM